MKKIGIGLKNTAYTPEAYAYKTFLEKNNFSIQLATEDKLFEDNDANIYFMGIQAFYKNISGTAKIIHEYQSLSTPPYARVKNYLKKIGNRKPDGRIFLNETVANELNFNETLPFIYRDMGIDDALFQIPSKNPSYDLIYCGSFANRKGLKEELFRLAKLNISILIVGDVNPEDRYFYQNFKHVKFTGRITRDELPSVYREARAGINFTPNVYPFNIQTSTKTLEYLASGLALVSNKYPWITAFQQHNKLDITWTENILTKDDLRLPSTQSDKMEKYSWDNILIQSNLITFLNNIIDPR